MGNDGVGPKMSKTIDVPGKINFHVAVDDEFHNVVLMMVGINNSKKIRMLRAFDDLKNIELIIARLQKAKVEAEKLRLEATAARDALKDARFIDVNVVDFIAWKQFAGIDLGPIGATLDDINMQTDERVDDVIVEEQSESLLAPTICAGTAGSCVEDDDSGPKAA